MGWRNSIGLLAVLMFGLVIFTMMVWGRTLGEVWVGLAGASIVGAAAVFVYFFKRERIR